MMACCEGPPKLFKQFEMEALPMNEKRVDEQTNRMLAPCSHPRGVAWLRYKKNPLFVLIWYNKSCGLNKLFHKPSIHVWLNQIMLSFYNYQHKLL